MHKNDVPVLTRARKCQPFFRIKQRISFGNSTRLPILESVWMFTGYTVHHPSVVCNKSCSFWVVAVGYKHSTPCWWFFMTHASCVVIKSCSFWDVAENLSNECRWIHGYLSFVFDKACSFWVAAEITQHCLSMHQWWLGWGISLFCFLLLQPAVCLREWVRQWTSCIQYISSVTWGLFFFWYKTCIWRIKQTKNACAMLNIFHLSYVWLTSYDSFPLRRKLKWASLMPPHKRVKTVKLL